MDTLKILPLEIFQLITNHTDVITKFKILSTCKNINENVYINTFYDELCYKDSIYEYPKNSHKLTSEILQKHKNITELNIEDNRYIYNDDIKHLKCLHTLYASGKSKISDEGIKHMKLHTLYAVGNEKISDEGIKDMKLHTCIAYNNPNINNKHNNIINLHK